MKLLLIALLDVINCYSQFQEFSQDDLDFVCTELKKWLIVKFLSTLFILKRGLEGATTPLTSFSGLLFPCGLFKFPKKARNSQSISFSQTQAEL